jgi:hypothetical protein
MDISKAGKGAPKPWEVGAGYETHVLLQQNSLIDGSENKWMNYLYLYAHADITARNRISIRWDAYNHYICDQGESPSCFRADDIYFTYTRLVNLPQKFDLRISGTLNAPVGWDSTRMGLITAPRLSVELSKKFSFGLSVDARLFGTFYIQRYTTRINGADPNPKAAFGGLLEAEYEFWFHKALVIGADLFDEYVWYYNPAMQTGATAPCNDITSTCQPAQQVWGAEVFVRYSFPAFYGIKSDITVALAQGDPLMGYVSVLHDGVQHPSENSVLLYTREFYASLGVRY